jgi:hypothetical protein
VSRPFNQPQPVAPETELSDFITVRNSGSETVSLLGCAFTPPSDAFTLVGIYTNREVWKPAFPIKVPGDGGKLNVRFLFKAGRDAGVLSSCLVFDFAGFRVSHDLHYSVTDSEVQALRPQSQNPPTVTPRLTGLPIVSEDSPPAACTRPLVRECVGGSEVSVRVRKVVFEGGSLPELEGRLSVENYVGRMAALYQMEELQMQVTLFLSSVWLFCLVSFFR